uniref:Uncharacterized protein n=1 Tax=Arundo donax TaxID=35708 RepID=A0A0A8XRQ6_ARUDO
MQACLDDRIWWGFGHFDKLIQQIFLTETGADVTHRVLKTKKKPAGNHGFEVTGPAR